MKTFKYLLCALRGHEQHLCFEPGRVFLTCVACGHESPGWTVGRVVAATGSASRAPRDGAPAHHNGESMPGVA